MRRWSIIGTARRLACPGVAYGERFQRADRNHLLAFVAAEASVCSLVASVRLRDAPSMELLSDVRNTGSGEARRDASQNQ